MPYRFDFEYTHHVLCCTFKGRITDRDLRQFHHDARRVVQRIDPHVAIVNFRPVTAFDVSSGAMRSLARSEPLMPDKTRPRFIVAPADLTFGMSRMYQIVGEITRPDLHVVRTRQEALSAIGLEDTKFQKIPEEVSWIPEE
jgi:hypothetical protein